jgi:hypothetical protein
VASGDLSLTVSDAIIAVNCQNVIKKQCDSKDELSLHAKPESRDHYRQWPGKMWRRTQEHHSFSAGLSKSDQIEMLKISNPTMNHLQRLCRSGTCEVSLLYQRNGESALRSVEGCTCTRNAAADYE